jgi:hypothetical protein
VPLDYHGNLRFFREQDGSNGRGGRRAPNAFLAPQWCDWSVLMQCRRAIQQAARSWGEACENSSNGDQTCGSWGRASHSSCDAVVARLLQVPARSWIAPRSFHTAPKTSLCHDLGQMGVFIAHLPVSAQAVNRWIVWHSSSLQTRAKMAPGYGSHSRSMSSCAIPSLSFRMSAHGC